MNKQSSNKHNKQDIVNLIFQTNEKIYFTPNINKSEEFANSNIALIKYWGKRNEELIIPDNTSISIPLNGLGSRTKIEINYSSDDKIYLNDILQPNESSFSQRIINFLNLFRNEKLKLTISTYNNIPTASGLASSASGFAALTLALNKLFNWSLNNKDLSILARLGSGSACRSIYNNGKAVIWHKGIMENGMDSFAEELDFDISYIKIDIKEISNQEKDISSRDGMKITKESSPLYQYWLEESKNHLQEMLLALEKKDFNLIGEISEKNATLMHATAIMSSSSVNYLTRETLSEMKKIQNDRINGIMKYYTIDAGSNLKILGLI